MKYQWQLVKAAAAKRPAVIILQSAASATEQDELWGGTDGVKVQVFLLNEDQGREFGNSVTNTPTKLVRIGARTLTPIPGAKQTSSYTSYGPGLGLEIKPEIAVSRLLKGETRPQRPSGFGCTPRSCLPRQARILAQTGLREG